MRKFCGVLALVLLVLMAGAAWGAAPTYNSISIASSGGFTNDSTPTITISITGDCNNVGFRCGTAGGTTEGDWDWAGSCPATYESFNITTGKNCTAGDGNKTVYSIAKDVNSNYSGTVFATVIYDTALPTITVVKPVNPTASEDRQVIFDVNDSTSGAKLDSITADWNGGADSFSTGICTAVGTNYRCTYNENNMLAAGDYAITVNASDNAGNAAAPAVKTFKYTDTGVPATVSGFSASAGNGQVSLNWNANGEIDLDSYYLYMGTAAGFTMNADSQIAVIAKGTNSYTKTGLTNGTPYYFKAKAKDKSGNMGNASEERTATPTSGTTPGMPDIRGDSEHSDNAWSNDTSAVFYWDNVSNANWYGCNWRTGDGTPGDGEYSSCSSGYSQSGLSNNTTYYLWVKACASGNSNCSSADKFTVRIDTEKPNKVTGLTARISGGDVKLNWSAPGDTGGSGTSRYRIYRSANSGFNVDYSDQYQFTDTMSATDYTDTSNLIEGKTYYYRVRAYDAAGNAGEVSDQRSIKAGSGSSGNLTLSIGAPEYVKSDTLEIVVKSSGGQMYDAYVKVNIQGDLTTLVSGRDNVSTISTSMKIPEKYQGKSGYVYVIAEDEYGETFDAQFDFVIDGKAPEISWSTEPAWDEANNRVSLGLKADGTGSGIETVTYYYEKGSSWVKIGEATLKGGVYSYTWNTKGLTGRYVIKAVAADKAGNEEETEPMSLVFTAAAQQETAEQAATTALEESTATEQPADITGLLFVGGGLLAGLVVLLAIVAVWLAVSHGREDTGMGSELISASDRMERSGSLFRSVRSSLNRGQKKTTIGRFAYRGRD